MRVSTLALLATGVILACSSPTSLCGCSPMPLPSALVTGTIRTADNVPVTGAFVSARSALGRCPLNGQAMVVQPMSMVTDADGSYRLPVLAAVRSLDTLCVQLVVRRTAAAGADTIASAPVPLELRTFAPFDSTRIDVRLP